MRCSFRRRIPHGDFLDSIRQIVGMMVAVSVQLTAIVWRTFRGEQVKSLLARPVSHLGGTRSEIFLLVLAYGLGGFGYIITATFLPVIARQVLPHTVWMDLFWPMFGVGTVVGALLSILAPKDFDRRNTLAGSYACQTVGVALTLFQPSIAGFVAGVSS